MESLPCGTRFYLWVGSVRIELNFRTHSRFPRFAWCGDNPTHALELGGRILVLQSPLASVSTGDWFQVPPRPPSDTNIWGRSSLLSKMA